MLAGYSFAVCFIVSSFFLHSRGIFFPYWMEEFQVARTEISAVVSFVLFTGACMAPITGFLIDKFPVKGIVTAGCLWLATGYVLLSTVDTYMAFLITFVVFQGIGWTYVGPLVQTKLMVNWFLKNRGMALGVAIMGISVAGIVMPTVATFLAESIGWRQSYTIYAGLLVALVLPLTWLVVKQSPSAIGQYPDGANRPPDLPAAPTRAADPESSSAWQRLKTTYLEFLTSKAFWSVVLTFGLMNGVYSAMITHLPTYLTTELPFSMVQAGLALTVAGAFAIAGKIVFGWMMDHVSAKVTVMFGVVSYFVSTLTFMNVHAFPAIIVAAGLFGLGFGGMVPVRSVILSRLFGAQKFSRVNGLLSFFLAPATFWVLITGWITDQTGTYVTAFQVWAIAFAGAGTITALIRLPNRDDAVG